MFNNYIYFDDLIELWIKLKQRGLKFILSKVNVYKMSRIVSAFNQNFDHANWWIIPDIKEYHNMKISGNKNISYEEHVSKNYIPELGKDQILVSFGCGVGNHEIRFAKLNPQLKVFGYDISPRLIENAKKSAQLDKVTNVYFYVQNVYDLKLEDKSIDYFLFHSSLHHFNNIKTFISRKIKPSLKKDGIVIINEYVGPNRMNFSNKQMYFCDSCLREIISKHNRIIYMSKAIKNRCYKLGKLRMIISDPSECVDSDSIMPVLKSEFEAVEIIGLGGNILMPVLKHIAHHFIETNKDELNELIKKEEDYLLNNTSDIIFAIFKNK